MRYMALQGDQGSVSFRWTKRGAIMWCLPRGPKSRAQGLESSWGMLRTCPGEDETRGPPSVATALSRPPRGQRASEGLRSASSSRDHHGAALIPQRLFPAHPACLSSPRKLAQSSRNTGVPLFSAGACADSHSCQSFGS